MAKLHETMDALTLKELLKYDPLTGRLIWLERKPEHFADSGSQTAAFKCKAWNARFANTSALEATNAEGYRHGRVNGLDVQTHRIVWAVHHGVWPDGIIDHINGDRTDNRIANLRVVDQIGNSRNAAKPATNKSGVVGVFQRARSARWIASTRIGGGKRELSYFDTFEEAVAARKDAERRHNYHRNHGREDASAA